ncbi:MAG TPA: UxaA family hydrolase [Jiangellaceae bacterium]|nr:UxaA family hydrolase [Jiangellaceae bacterium]
MRQSFLVHHVGDTVGVAVQDIPEARKVSGRVQSTGDELELEVVEPVPLGHKVALRDIASGEPVIKYGVAIGLATADINTGQRVHVHNLKGQRWA